MPGFFNGPAQGVSNTIPEKKGTSHKTRLIGFTAIILLVVSLPIIIIFSRNRQDTRQRASGFDISQYTTCGTSPADIMLLMDRSGSMSQPLGNTSTTKLAAAQAAAKNFIDILAANSQNQVGLASFSTTSTLDSKLTSNFTNVKSKIDGLSANGNTCAECGTKTSGDEVHTDGRAKMKKVVIFLTDGIANTVIGNPNKVPPAQAEAATITQVQNSFKADNTIYFTIGLGNKNGNSETGINEAFLKQIAAITGGKYYYSPTTDDLNQIYQDISNVIGKGTISGTVFNDANNNGTLDSGEVGLGNWTVNLKDPSNANTINTTQSAADGTYTFTGVCNNSYTVSEVVQTGWNQTSPPDPRFYAITISNADNITGKDFGNTQNICGLTCTQDVDCSQSTNGCTFCDPGTSKCSPKPTVTPTPSVCLTPGPIKNVQIICTNCSSGQ